MATDPKLLELIGDTAELMDVGDFSRALIRALRAAVPANWVALNDIGPDPDSITVLIDPEMDRASLEIFADLAHQNPLIQRYNATRDGRTRRMSEVVTLDEFHAMELYERFYALHHVEYQLAFTLPHVKDRILGVAMTREHEDFTDAETELIEAARPFLIQAYRNAVRYEELLSSSGEGRAGPPLPAVESLQALGLTRRQAETLQLVATGAAERDIADRLGISDRTVQKHLELCYRRLGISSRSEAASIAWAHA